MNRIQEWMYIGKYRETKDVSLLKYAHPETMPHFRLWDSLCEYYDEPIPWTDLVHH